VVDGKACGGEYLGKSSNETNMLEGSPESRNRSLTDSQFTIQRWFTKLDNRGNFLNPRSENYDHVHSFTSKKQLSSQRRPEFIACKM
jgi:hypothetical protein